MTPVSTITKKELRDLLKVSHTTLIRYLSQKTLQEKLNAAGCHDIKRSIIIMPKARKIIFEHLGISEEEYSEYLNEIKKPGIGQPGE